MDQTFRPLRLRTALMFSVGAHALLAVGAVHRAPTALTGSAPAAGYMEISLRSVGVPAAQAAHPDDTTVRVPPGENIERLPTITPQAASQGSDTAGRDAVAHQESGGREAASAYLAAIRERIVRAKYYPDAALRCRLEGTVPVQFVVFRNGAIGPITLGKPSCHRLLAQAARETIRQAAPFPGFPTDIAGEALELHITLAYEIPSLSMLP